ncbi:histidine kinase [Nocardia fluminea]|uniref:histidine kinase n=1 Tax=Nocardia fluminea TaxID=134984 RepID=UPI003D111669
MDTDGAARFGAWQQTWRLTAAAALGAVFWLTVAATLPTGCAADTCSWLVTGDPLIALGCLTVLLWRRRFPFTVALVVVIASAASALATGAALLALCSLSTRRRPVEIGVVVVAYVTAAQFTEVLYPIGTLPAPIWLQLALPLSSAGIAVATGVAIDARRVEVRSLRDRADSAEREQAARAAQAQATERNRIAREMHNVLAHRISLVAMQAGVLDHRDDLSAEEKRPLIRGIADGSRQALEELRDVLGVLRADPDRPEPPQPTLDRLSGNSGRAHERRETCPGRGGPHHCGRDARRRTARQRPQFGGRHRRRPATGLGLRSPRPRRTNHPRRRNTRPPSHIRQRIRSHRATSLAAARPREKSLSAQ